MSHISHAQQPHVTTGFHTGPQRFRTSLSLQIGPLASTTALGDNQDWTNTAVSGRRSEYLGHHKKFKPPWPLSPPSFSSLHGSNLSSGGTLLTRLGRPCLLLKGMPSRIRVTDRHNPVRAQPPVKVLMFLLSLKEACPLRRTLLLPVPSPVLARFFFTPQHYWPGAGVDILFLLVVASGLLGKPSVKHKARVTPATHPKVIVSYPPGCWSPTLPFHSLKILTYHLSSFSSPL